MPSSTSSLAGKVALVSGASSGIGAAIAQELSRRGAHVIINYPDPSQLPAAEAVLRNLSPGHARSVVIEADLSTISGPDTLAAQAAAAFYGRIDILVNNAGVSKLSQLDGPEDAAALAQLWDSIVAVNGRGTLLLTKAVLKYLADHQSRIVNICGTASRYPQPNMTIYAGSKGMVDSFTRCWARDLPRRYGCTVNAVAPGPVSTEHMLAAPKEFQDALRAKFESVPMASRMATPQEVAWTVAMLCEPEAGWINGAWVPVDGGWALP